MSGGPEDFDPYPPRAAPDLDPARLAAAAFLAAVRRAPRELDTADLTVAGGDVVQIICLADVMDWLGGLAIRAEAGEQL